MRHKRFSIISVAILAATFTFAEIGRTELCVGPKVESFAVLIDLSYSRSENFADQSTLLGQIVLLIPDSQYVSALRSFHNYPFGRGPVTELAAGIGPFDKDAWLGAIKGLEVHRALTPLGPAMAAAGGDLAQMTGDKALIVLSDFRWSEGFGDPVREATVLAAKHPELSIYAIHLGRDREGAKRAEEIVRAAGRGKVYDGLALKADSAALKQAVQEMFPAGAGDADGDGVCDGDDQCPETPKDFKVDGRGCPVLGYISLNIQFDTAKDDIKPEYHDRLAKVADYLRQYPFTQAAIKGHTDDRGSDEYNRDLSQRRAESAMNYLSEKLGIEAGRMKAVGYGESQPIVPNDTERGRYQNRRVDVIISGNFEKK
jgi:OOP family OmpA-OmpF porin